MPGWGSPLWNHHLWTLHVHTHLLLHHLSYSKYRLDQKGTLLGCQVWVFKGFHFKKLHTIVSLSWECVHWEGTWERHFAVYQISICRNKLQCLCSPAWHSLIQPLLKINTPIKHIRKRRRKKSPEKPTKAGAAAAGQASLGQAAGSPAVAAGQQPFHLGKPVTCLPVWVRANMMDLET